MFLRSTQLVGTGEISGFNSGLSGAAAATTGNVTPDTGSTPGIPIGSTPVGAMVGGERLVARGIVDVVVVVVVVPSAPASPLFNNFAISCARVCGPSVIPAMVNGYERCTTVMV